MNITIRLIIVILLAAVPIGKSAESNAKQFLRNIYGAEGIDISKICHPSQDVWMVRGVKNTNALAIVDGLKFESKRTGIFSGLVGTDLYFIELRDGLVDPVFNLDGIYLMHRRLVLRFLYAALSGDQTMLGGLVTDAGKVKIIGPKAASGDMDQYTSIIEIMPVVRSSKPGDDATTKSVTYRVPLGDVALALTLVKEGNSWKIDTSKTVRLPLEFFFR